MNYYLPRPPPPPLLPPPPRDDDEPPPLLDAGLEEPPPPLRTELELFEEERCAGCEELRCGEPTLAGCWLLPPVFTPLLFPLFVFAGAEERVLGVFTPCCGRCELCVFGCAGRVAGCCTGR